MLPRQDICIRANPRPRNYFDVNEGGETFNERVVRIENTVLFRREKRRYGKMNGGRNEALNEVSLNHAGLRSGQLMVGLLRDEQKQCHLCLEDFMTRWVHLHLI